MFPWAQFFLYVLVTAGTPGPNTLSSMSNGSRLGFRRTLPYIFGIWTGFSIVSIACTLLCSTLDALIPAIRKPMLVLGACYILYLAWKTLIRKTGDAAAESKPLTYVNGFLLQFLNVKILMLGIAFYSGYIMPYGFRVGRVLAFAVIMTVCAGTGNLIWATLGTMLFPLYKRYNKAINVVMALLLVWSAWKIVSI